MKTITLNTRNLTAAITGASAFTQKDGMFIDKVTIVGEEGVLKVKATNHLQGIVYKNIPFVSADLTDTSFDAFSVTSKDILKVLKAAKGDEVLIEIDAEQITLKSGRSKSKLQTMTAAQEFEIKKGEGIDIDFTAQIDQLSKVLHAVDRNNPKPEINSVLMEVKNGKFTTVGTDTRRLAILSSKMDQDDMSIIVPKESVSYMTKLFKRTTASVEIAESSISAFSEFVDFTTKLTSGSYPQWERIVPPSFEQTVKLDRDNIIELLQEVSIFEPDVLVTIRDGKISMVDKDLKTEVEDSFDGECDICFGIDARQLLDFLNICDEDIIEMGFNSHATPILFSASNECKEIIMPVMLEALMDTKEERAA